ncbi:MAG: VOC family protein [Chitinophagaceae bacterium]|nr:VOC family protein [Chitinophagaceae bacterium]
MKIQVTSIMVNDQDRAFEFYTQILGFEKKREIPFEDGRWLTIVSNEDKDGVELLLAPLQFEPAIVYQKALYEAGMPALTLTVDDIDHEYNRLTQLGIVFSMVPTQMGISKLAVFDDTCGNKVQLVQVL